MADALIVSCPHCRRSFSYYTSSFRPFCSERCKMVDLGQWLAGEHRIPSSGPPNDEDLMAVEGDGDE